VETKYGAPKKSNPRVPNIMTNERWEPITEYEGLYEVSDLGRVRRTADSSNRRFKKGYELSPMSVGKGYLSVTLHDDGRNQRCYVHRLVGFAFCSPPVSLDGVEINHRNGVKTDNRAENLEWVTRSENMRHSHQILGSPPPPIGIGEKNGRAKLTESDVLQIRAKYSNGQITQAELARFYKVTPAMIGYIVRRDYWTHI